MLAVEGLRCQPVGDWLLGVHEQWQKLRPKEWMGPFCSQPARWQMGEQVPALVNGDSYFSVLATTTSTVLHNFCDYLI